MNDAFDLSTAAEICGVSRTTIRRFLDRGAFPNAFRSGHTVTSPWLIPLCDLRAAGYRPSPLPAVVPTTQLGQVAEQDAADLHMRLAVAEAIAQERSTLIDVLRVEIRFLHESLQRAIGVTSVKTQ